MILILASAGGALSLFLLLVLAAKYESRPGDPWLGLWFLAQFLFCLGVIVALVASPRIALIALLVGQFGQFLSGPSHYLYAACSLGAQRRLRQHAVAVAAVTAGVFSVLLAAPVRAEAGALVVNANTPWTRWLVVVPLLGVALASLYPVGALRLVYAARQPREGPRAEPSSHVLAWLPTWSGAILAVNGGLLLTFAMSFFAGWSVDAQVAVIMSLQVLLIGYVGQRGLARNGVIAGRSPAVQSVRRHIADGAGAAADYAHFQALLATDKPHLLPELTAEMLADRLGWAPGRLTDALRHGGGTTIFDAVNAARVREVQRLALLPTNSRVSLLTLSHHAGFGSKTAFYEAFRRHVGCTPAAWRRRHVGG